MHPNPPPLDPVLRQELYQEYFAEEVRELEGMIGIDLSGWK